MLNTAEVRTVNGRFEVRINGLSRQSSAEEVRELAAEGWLIHWNPSDRPISISDIHHFCGQR